MFGFISHFIIPLCLLAIILIYYGVKDEMQKNKRQDEINNQILQRWSENKERYKESLMNGDRHDVLKYGRMCGYDELRITNDLLCYLKNIN